MTLEGIDHPFVHGLSATRSVEETTPISHWIVMRGWHGALSKKRMTFRPHFTILLLKLVSHSVIKLPVIHPFLLFPKETFIFLKQRGFPAFPITTGFSISPAIFPHRNTVSLPFDIFPPTHFSPRKVSDLVGRVR